MRSDFIIRVRLISAAFVITAFLLVGQLYLLQIVRGDVYQAKAYDQYVGGGGGRTFARGDILFTRANGEESVAATTESGWKLALQPIHLNNPREVFEKILTVVDLDEKRFFESANKKDDPYEEIAFRLSDAQGEALRDLEITGVLVVREAWRTYPAEKLSAHALGFVGFKDHDRVGVYGLERYYEDTLRQDVDSLAVNPFAELFSNVSSALAENPAEYEGDIIASIEPAVQAELERTLEIVKKKFAPTQVGGIVMNPKTGEVMALGVTPSFDPNTYNKVTDQSVFTNPIVEGTYEMGSILKPLTVAAGIDVGAITPQMTYDDKGFVMRSGKRISNFDGKGRGVVSMQEVLSQSLNTGIAFIVSKMGSDVWGDYVRALKLGEETGIDLPNEVAGNINAVNKGGSDVDFASAGFGQSIAVTPIQMIRALSALANDGVLPEPRVARAVRYPNGVTRNLSSPPAVRVYKKETAATVTNMLVKVFDDALLEGDLKQEHYSFAAKTGTAQIARSECGGYCDGRFLHSFFGYYPASAPKFIILLYAVEPTGEQYASRTLARPFLELAKFTLNHYNIPPDR